MKKQCLLMIFIGAMTLRADNMITDFETIARIELNLKPNQTLMIDHKRGVLLGIMEISESGKIKRLPIPQELIGKSESDVMGGGSQSNYEKSTSSFGGSSTTIYHKKEPLKETSKNTPKAPTQVSPSEEKIKMSGKPQTPKTNEKGVEDTKQGVKKREGEREWDKSKIIYEQKNETLEILR